jgi:hypothetical protein
MVFAVTRPHEARACTPPQPIRRRAAPPRGAARPADRLRPTTSHKLVRVPRSPSLHRSLVRALGTLLAGALGWSHHDDNPAGSLILAGAFVWRFAHSSA